MNPPDRFKKSLITALLALHEAIRRDHPDDPIRAFGIFACNEGDGIEPFYHLQSRLDQRAASEGIGSQSEHFVIEAPDFESTDKYLSLFHDATERYRRICEEADDEADMDELHADLYTVMLDSIRAVDRKGIFDKDGDRDHVFLFLHTLEMANSEISDFARQLNPQSVLHWALGPEPQLPTTGSLVAIGKVASSRYDGLSMTTDGKCLAISGWGGGYRVWDTSDFFNERTKFSTWQIGFTACALSNDGGRLYLAWRQNAPEERGILEALTTKSKRRNVFTTHGREVWALAIHPTQNLLAMGEDNGQVCLWSEQDDKPMHSFKAQSGAIRSIVFSPDGARMFTASRESGIRVWNTENWQQLWHHPLATEALALSPDGKELACVASGDTESQTVHIRNTADGSTIMEINLADGSTCNHESTYSHLYYGARCLAISRDGLRLAVGIGFGEDGAHTRLYGIPSGEKIATCHSGHECIGGLGFLPDNRTIAITGNHHRGAPLYLWTPEVIDC